MKDVKIVFVAGVLGLLSVGCSIAKSGSATSSSASSVTQSSGRAAISSMATQTYAGTMPALGGQDGLTGNPRYVLNPNFTFGGDGAKALPVATSLGQVMKTSKTVGSISVPYILSDGSGSGSCSYTVGVPGQANAATAMNIDGSCKTPSGQSFLSTGVMVQGFHPYGVYNLVVGFGVSNGWYVSLTAVVDLFTGKVSEIKVMAPNPKDPMKGQQVEIATGTGGSTNTENPYAKANTSVVVALKLSEGSVCMVTSNAWAGSGFEQQTLSANCTSPSGATFSLYGTAGLCGVTCAGSFFFELEGVGVNSKTYRVVGAYNPANGQISQTGGYIDVPATSGNNTGLTAVAASVQAQVSVAPYHIAFSGSAIGACSILSPDANGNLTGACLLSDNTSFAISGTAIASGNGMYNVKLNGTVHGVAFNSTISFDSVLNKGSGSWSSADGGAGQVAAN